MRTTKKKPIIKKEHTVKNDYSVAGETMSVQEKLDVLDLIGRKDLVEIFKEWEPRQVKHQKKAAPLDQRVSITVTDLEKLNLMNELNTTNKIGEKVSISQFVRNRAIGSLDVNGWKDLALEALKEINEIDSRRADLARREREIKLALEEESDSEEIGMLEIELSKIEAKFRKVIAQNEKRRNRLSGRMSLPEAETVKWRASRLCISTSDYLRFMIFDLIPNTAADAHMSLDAKRRFYVSIIEVADNGWGTPPTISHCNQCLNYVDEISRLKERVKQLEQFG